MRMLAPWRALPRIGRRRFVQGLAGGTLLLGAGTLFGRAQTDSPTVLSCSQFDLSMNASSRCNDTTAARRASPRS